MSQKAGMVLVDVGVKDRAFHFAADPAIGTDCRRPADARRKELRAVVDMAGPRDMGERLEHGPRPDRDRPL